MKTALEQSIKEKIKALAKERETTFAELWRTLILERFLSRLAHSSQKEKFILKGGTLLAKYIPIGRETQDLDFFVQNVPNKEYSLKMILQTICDIEANDSFAFEVSNIKILSHSQLEYTGAEIKMLAKFGATKTIVRMDLGFGDYVDPIENVIDLTSTSKGPLFESKISLHCYPKEFIFAEKLETVIFRGAGNTRMKDFHDLYSLVKAGILDDSLGEEAVQLVFQHRHTSLKKIPIVLGKDALDKLERNWKNYHNKLRTRENASSIPASLAQIVTDLNEWIRIHLNELM